MKSIPVILLCFAIACATVLPAHLTDAGKHPAYPPSDYITAVGESDKSATDAEALAKAKVSEQIGSKISYYYELAMNNEGISSSGVVKKDTNFAHAEMIRIDTASSMKGSDRYYAFAYLSRQEVSRVLTREYETEAVVFRRVAGMLKGMGGDVAAYTAAVRQAQGSYGHLAARSFAIQAVAGQEYAPYQQDTDTFLILEHDRISRLRSLKLTVTLENGGKDGAREVILMAITGALTRMGLEATPGACAPQRYALRVKYDTPCVRGSFGPQCSLRMSAALEHCATGKVLAEIDISDPSFRGVNTRDEAKALQDLYGTITPAALAPILTKGLRNIFPIDEAVPGK